MTITELKLLLNFFPTHDRTSCSDESPVNDYPNNSGYYRCNRCTIMSFIRDEWIPAQTGFDLSLVIYDERKDPQRINRK